MPILYQGQFDTPPIFQALAALAMDGSRAALGFRKPEGIVIFHVAGNVSFKKTIEKDDCWTTFVCTEGYTFDGGGQ